MQIPPFDEELDAALATVRQTMPIPVTITPDMIPMMRAALASNIDDLLAAHNIRRRDVEIESYDGATIGLSILKPAGQTGTNPGFYHVHGGGMIVGDRWTDIERLLEWVIRYNAVGATVEYRLAPENPDPAPVEDCYSGLVWTATHSDELGIDPRKLLITGGSAGGGLAAGVALMARDRKGPKLLAQMLNYPMLDDRDHTVSARQIDGVGLWDRESNRTGWNALLGDRTGSDDVSIYSAPARATDLSNLPPAFIDCGSAEVFRDEDVAYATQIWAGGGQAELHVWPGGFHTFELFAPQTALARAAIATRRTWLDRILRTTPDAVR